MTQVNSSSRASVPSTQDSWSSYNPAAKKASSHQTSLYIKDDLKIDKEKLHAAGSVWGFAAQQAAGAYQS